MSKAMRKDQEQPVPHVADSHDRVRVHGARVNSLQDVIIESRSVG